MNSDIRFSRDLKLSDFDYELPDDRIAFRPKAERDSSRLLVYSNGRIMEDTYANLSSRLDSGHFLVFNNSSVVQARLLFQTATAKPVEIFCLEPADKNLDQTMALQSRGSVLWRCFVGNVKKWKEKELRLTVSGGRKFDLYAGLIEKEADSYIVKLQWDTDLTFAEVLEEAGKMPLPPYIEREADVEDHITYQTIYASDKGSVAAPTAGLHFTENIFDRFRERNIAFDYLTLHVGAGTFKPVKAQEVCGHVMHDEQILIESGFLTNLLTQLRKKKKIVAVGTTSARFLESIYWLGCKIGSGQHTGDALWLGQWEASVLKPMPAENAVTVLLEWMKTGGINRIQARTAIMITPGYEWRIVEKLITNFHQPKSTLILLIASFIGDDWKKLYQYALDHDFRFLSYGDGCLLER